MAPKGAGTQVPLNPGLFGILDYPPLAKPGAM